MEFLTKPERYYLDHHYVRGLTCNCGRCPTREKLAERVRRAYEKFAELGWLTPRQLEELRVYGGFTFQKRGRTWALVETDGYPVRFQTEKDGATYWKGLCMEFDDDARDAEGNYFTDDYPEYDLMVALYLAITADPLDVIGRAGITGRYVNVSLEY